MLMWAQRLESAQAQMNKAEALLDMEMLSLDTCRIDRRCKLCNDAMALIGQSRDIRHISSGRCISAPRAPMSDPVDKWGKIKNKKINYLEKKSNYIT